MKESYVEGLATHNGPESCGAAREGEAPSGRAGRLRSGCNGSITPRSDRNRNAAFTYRYFGISRQAFYRNDLDFN